MTNTLRTPYDGVVIAAPVTIPYVRYSIESAHWWIGRALSTLVAQAGIKASDIDGLCVSSFTLLPDTAVGLTQHFGLSPRWLDHIPMGGASGIVALRRAARAVQAGDADIVACIAGDTNHVDLVPADAGELQPLRARRGLSLRRRRAERELRAAHRATTCATTASRRADFGKLCVAQRDNALPIPHALFEEAADARANISTRGRSPIR